MLVLHESEATRQSPQQHTLDHSRPVLEMKKGKSNVPPMMRKQYDKQKELVEMRKQMIAASKPGSDGLPVFNLFVRSKKQKMWYPCGSFKGDDRSAGLAKNYADKNLLAGISKSQLDGGISGSLYKDMAKLIDSVGRAYPQLRKSKDDLEWGYRLAFAGLDDAAEPITLIEPKESKGLIDNIKSAFGG